jgi:hypothetical protein
MNNHNAAILDPRMPKRYVQHFTAPERLVQEQRNAVCRHIPCRGWLGWLERALRRVRLPDESRVETLPARLRAALGTAQHHFVLANRDSRSDGFCQRNKDLLLLQTPRTTSER